MKKIALSIIIYLFASLSISAQLVSSDDYTFDYQRDALKIYKDTIEMRTAAGYGEVKIMAHYLADRFRDVTGTCLWFCA